MTKSRPLSHNSCLGDQSNLTSPSDSSRHLPAELLAYLFIFIARDSYIDEKYCYSYPIRPSWVNVSYVCRYWRDVALNCPTLWSYIPATSQRWTEELLARSQMAPLKISMNVTAIYCQFNSRQLEVLSIVEQVMKHSQRIQKLRLDVASVSQETRYQILSKFLFTRIPHLQHLEISHFNLPEGESWFPFEENTPALRTLGLNFSWIPWYALGPSGLTTLRLHLLSVGFFTTENTMADFLAMLRRMPHLVQLYVEDSLPSARDFLSNGEFHATPVINLPHLSHMSITTVPLSAVTALVSCVDIPLTAKVHLEAMLENTSEYMSTLDDYICLVSLLGQRISQSNSPKFRSLTIGSERVPALAFSTSERAKLRYSPALFYSIKSDENTLLTVTFHSADIPMHQLDYPVLSSICSAIPLTNIQSVHFLGSWFEPECWRDLLVSLSNVRHIRFTQNAILNITSVFSLPASGFTRVWEFCPYIGQGERFVPALEELELDQITLNTLGKDGNPDRYVADMQDLYNAIATRKETRCQLTIKDSHLVTRSGRKALESVGWWEGDQFRVTSSV